MGVLDKFRHRVIAVLGEPEKESCSWYDAASATPWYMVDSALDFAEQDVGNELITGGGEDSILVKSASITVPASTTTGFNEVAWSTLDPTGALPGSKILTIKDAANGLPVYFIMEPFDRMDMYDPGPMSRPATRFAVGSTAIILYKNTICFPYDAATRTLVFYYIPAFGRMTGIGSIAVTAAGTGYTSAPTVTISGNGYSATATATLSSTTVASIAVVNPGAGYIDETTVSITGGGGTSAAATATVGVAPVLPDKAYSALIYRAAMLLMRVSQRDESQMEKNYREALASVVSVVQNDARGKTFLRRPRYKGI